MTEAALILKRLRDYSNVVEFPSHPAENKDRRVAICDRRQCHTYLAKDRRSGIAERRGKNPYEHEVVRILRRRILRSLT